MAGTAAAHRCNETQQKHLLTAALAVTAAGLSSAGQQHPHSLQVGIHSLERLLNHCDVHIFTVADDVFWEDEV